MSVAELAPPPPVGEPTTLRQLYDRAQSDLKSPTARTHLNWVFIHAKAVGRLEVARAALKRYEQEDFDMRCRAAAFMPGTTQYQAYMDMRPAAEVKRAEAYVTEQASFVEAARAVVDMLEVATRPPVRAVR
jgi:hypothetical protein